MGAVCGPSGRILLVGLTRRAGAGRLGYAEAVQVELPTARMGEFAGTFFERFRGGVRHDPQDVGGGSTGRSWASREASAAPCLPPSRRPLGARG